MTSERARDDDDPEPRVIAGRYHLVQSIGEGGAGEVFEARDVVTNTTVAVKLLHAGAGAQVPRVRREVGALRLLRLPGVVHLIDDGTDGGRPFLVMEYVRGSPFPGRPGKTDWATLAPLAHALLDVLGRVHGVGVIHRDIKPSNVFVHAVDGVRILDFGLSTGPALGAAVTAPGTIVGTPEYLAPEQVLSRRPDARTDLYAVGVMLYEALSGRLPHGQTGFRELLHAKLSHAPRPLRHAAPDVPRAVAAAIDALLAPDPQDRPRSTGEVERALFGADAGRTRAAQVPLIAVQPLVTSLVASLRERRSRDISGPRGSGRSRVLEEVATGLEAGGVEVAWLPPGRRPLASLAALIGSAEDLGATSGDEAQAEAARRLDDKLRQGVVILADDAERLDDWSAAALDACRAAGGVLRAFGAPRADAAPLAPFTELELRALVRGPDRVLHLRQDAAHELWLRTGGLAERVAAELAAWVRAGLAHWEQERLAIDSEAIHRLRSGLVVGTALAIGVPAAGARTSHLEDLLSWVTLAWPRSTPTVLAGALDRPAWIVDVELDDLVDSGAVRRLPDGRCLPTAAAPSLGAWGAEQRIEAHRALARTLPAGSVDRLRHLLAAGDVDESVEAALGLSRELVHGGRPADALAVLDAVLGAARRAGATNGETDLVVEYTKACLADGTQPALNRALYEVTRRALPDARSSALEHLLRGAREAAVGDPDAALQRLDGLDVGADEGLQLWRQAQRARASTRLPRERQEAVLDDIARWVGSVGTRRARSGLAGWRAHLMYGAGRYAEAAELHLEAAALTDRVTARLSGWVGAGGAFREAGLLARARSSALRARCLAEEVRHAMYEARALYVERSCAYRMGADVEPDPEFVEALEVLGAPDLLAVGLLTEAAVLRRRGRSADAAACALRAERSLQEIRFAPAQLLCRGLAAEAGAVQIDADDFIREAARCPLPGFGLQALGLAAPVLGGADRARAAQVAAAHAASLPDEDPDSVREILSIEECLARLGSRPV